MTPAEQVAAQPYAALLCLYAGIVCGIVYDLFRLVRRLWRARPVEPVCDALFSAALGAIAAAMLLLATGGRLRLYLFLFAGAGYALEQFAVYGTISRIVHTWMRKRAGIH